jgi:glycerol-3-phosphate O-acyltransferase / dihydroxyacetone phosphate acyltransferase
VIPKLD